MKLSVIIPVYNEINTILEVLRRVNAVPLDKEIIIIDDGSTDGTREVLEGIKEENVKIIFNERNRGKGFSIRKGFEYITGDIVIIQDAVIEYYPDEYPILIQKIIENKADVVYGTRFLGTHRVGYFYHYLGNLLLNFIANVLYDINLSDLMTCHKACKFEVIKKLKLRANGVGVEAEITAQIFRRRLRVYEVPISYNGRDYDEGKKNTWKDFFRLLYWLLKCKFESFDISEDTLYRMRMMQNNNRWVFDRIKPFIGKNVVEIGSGIGNISKFLVSFERNVILTDINETYLSYLKHRFIGNPKVNILSHDVLSGDPSNIARFKIDTVVCINVLEHIEDDQRVLDNIYKILEPGGRLILFVPALKILQGTLDEKLGHFYRYGKKDLLKKLEAANFSVENFFYHNFIATLGWFLNGKIFKREIMSSFQVKMFDKLIPFFAIIERKVKIPFGMSLIAICKKK